MKKGYSELGVRGFPVAGARWEAIFDTALDAIVGIDVAGRISLFNRAAEEMFGYGGEEVLGQTVGMLMPTPYRGEHDTYVQRYWKTHAAHAVGRIRSVSAQRKNGEVFPVEISVSESPVDDEVRFVAIIRDMTERLRDEEALRANEARYHDLYNHAPCGYHSIDEAGIVIEMNDTELSWLGYLRGEVVGKLAYADLMTAGSRALFAERFPLLKKNGWVRDLEYELVRQDGSILPVLLSATQVSDQAGRFLYSRATVYDISERRRADAATRELAAIVESSDDGIFATRLDGTIASWNGGAERMYGYTAAEVIGRPIDAIVPEERADEALSILGLIRCGERVQDRETTGRCRDGRRIDVSLTVSPIHNPAGKLVAASVIARDITERKALERLRADFVATLTHDIRNPAGNVAAFLEMLREGGDLNADALELVERMEQSVDTIFELVTNHLDRARLESGLIELRKSPQDLNETLTELAQQYEPAAARRGIALTLELEPGLPPVDADPLALARIFGNLLHNAVKFTPAGGSVTIRSRVENGAVAASVADTGPGIPAKELPELFSANRGVLSFHSLRGTGLGLYIVHSLVEAHGGTIEADSGPGGSCFTVRLAPVEGTAASPPSN